MVRPQLVVDLRRHQHKHVMQLTVADRYLFLSRSKFDLGKSSLLCEHPFCTLELQVSDVLVCTRQRLELHKYTVSDFERSTLLETHDFSHSSLVWQLHDLDHLHARNQPSFEPCQRRRTVAWRI